MTAKPMDLIRTITYTLPEGAMSYEQLNMYYRECIAERDEQRDRITALEAQNARLKDALNDVIELGERACVYPRSDSNRADLETTLRNASAALAELSTKETA